MKRVLSSGFSLVEVTLALGIAAVCLIAIFALLPMGVASNQAAISDTIAANIATSIISDLRSSITANRISSRSQSIVFGLPIPFAGMQTVFLADAGQITGTANQNAGPSMDPPPRYRATLFFVPQAAPQATNIRLLITWPALSDPTASSPPTKYSGSFEIVTSIDVN